MQRRWPWTLRTLAGLAVLGVLATAACGTYRPQDVRPGMSEAEAAALLGRPTGRYPGPNGQTRVEFATGPYGRVTWMLDLDASGQVIGAPQQVLNEASFSWIQQNARDHDAKWLLYHLADPAYAFLFDPPPPGGTGVLAETGPWAMFRLFGRGTLRQADSPERYTLTFTLGNREATFELRAASVLNPFAPGVLQDFRCPSVRE